jgi:hypothetical protein
MKNLPKRISKKAAEKNVIKEKKPLVHRISLSFNADEYKAIERHLKKYRIKIKSKWFRTIIMTEIWQKMSRDYPTLFNEEEMR